MNTLEKVRESNRIEGINRAPTLAEIAAHDHFVQLDKFTVHDLSRFVGVYQADAKLRDRVGLDVRVGNHYPPRGGPHISEQLNALIADIHSDKLDAFEAHQQYEALHPFTDGNGRSGRVVWYWMMVGTQLSSLGFLHAFYYQSLQAYRGAKP